MSKIVTIIGARPQMIKAATVSHQLRKEHEEILVHTGQHYDANMSDVFFEELDIPKPNHYLNIGSGGHGRQTGRMLEKLETILLQEKPDSVLVYGDTNSTLAGALAASKLLIPVIHVEAGLRSFNKNMPEEQNRILTDHLATLLFAPTLTACNNLANEGIACGVFNVGDIMYDGVLRYKEKVKNLPPPVRIKEPFILATAHRAENTDSPERLASIVNALNNCGKKVVFPMHPRTHKYMQQYNLTFKENIHVIEPVGYLGMLWLEENATKIVTDSGGVQKEAYFLARPCITMRGETEWIETVDNGWNVLVGADGEKIIDMIENFAPSGKPAPAFGDGTSCAQMLSHL